MGRTGSRTFTAQLLAPKCRFRSRIRLSHCRRSGISKLSSADLEVLEGFFSRRLDMSLETRQALALRIAAAIQAKSGLETPQGVSVETFLEATARQLRDQARLQ